MTAADPHRFMTDRVIPTSRADIAIAQSAGDGPPVLLIHGNSSCKAVFRHQLSGAIGRRWRLIAMDLPGHGASSDAADPAETYTIPGYAETAFEVMRALGHDRFAVVGWSLGGHVAIDMAPKSGAVTGLMVTGTPPIGNEPGALGKGFLPSEHMGLAGQRDFSDAEAEGYARATAGEPFEAFLLDAARRTDGRAREGMIGHFATGQCRSQTEIVGLCATPLAVVNGAEEPFVNNAFVTSVDYAALWEGRVHLLPGLGHAPFWQDPAAYDPILARFLSDVAP